MMTFSRNGFVSRIIRKSTPNAVVLSASGCEEALQMLNWYNRPMAEQPFDLVITDIYLGGERTGIDVYKACQELYPAMPVIVTSVITVDSFNKIISETDSVPPFLTQAVLY